VRLMALKVWLASKLARPVCYEYSNDSAGARNEIPMRETVNGRSVLYIGIVLRSVETRG